MHPTIQLAIEKGVTTFATDDGEWELKLESYPPVEKFFGRPLVIFANDGGGDFLFISAKDVTAKFPQVYTYWREGPELTKVAEPLHIILGLADRSASNAAIPTYSTGEQMALGDIIEYRSFFIWRRATISYVPGISKRDPGLEFDGIRQALFRKANGGNYTLWIDREKNIVGGRIRFVARASG